MQEHVPIENHQKLSTLARVVFFSFHRVEDLYRISFSNLTYAEFKGQGDDPN